MNFLKSFIKAERDKSIKMYEKYVGPIPLKYGEDGRFIAAEANTKLDAFRHAYTSGRIAMKFGEVTAKVLKQDISNKERFLKGNPGVAEMYQNMARQQSLIEDFFKSMPGKASQSSNDDDL